MIDPISILVTVLALYGLAKRSPRLLGELAEEWQAARRGEESPSAAARRQRLIANGIDPTTGGPMRQYVGNRWRDFWLDEDLKATRRRAERLDKEAAGEVLSWRERMESRMDDEVTRRAEQWRTRPDGDTTPPVTVTDIPRQNPGGSTPPPQRDGHTNPGWASDTVHDTPPTGGPEHTSPPPHDTPPTGGPDREPIRVDVTVGEPTRPTSSQPTAEPAAITAGGTMSNTVAQQAVTGVVSGAAEARAIETALNAATEEYVTRLNRLRGRIAQLGEQTVGTVQMSGRSQVVANIAAAAEAAAAAQANARSCTTEVVPLLGQVARAFERINS
ncbi:hypothetical protein [Micromonospora sp. NBC_00421]|uniref:hypothetical protein n=1 Tax=Micromonospora sp. NBC_00421 TaxID=2975976 RepID=UPI002E1EDF5A